jgi:hypothetical protein
MALSIGVHEGSKVMVGGSILSVLDIASSTHVSVEFKGKTFLITDAARTKVADDVFISCGSKQQKHERYSRLAFEAPRDIPISRV